MEQAGMSYNWAYNKVVNIYTFLISLIIMQKII